MSFHGELAGSAAQRRRPAPLVAATRADVRADGPRRILPPQCWTVDESGGEARGAGRGGVRVARSPTGKKHSSFSMVTGQCWRGAGKENLRPRSSLCSQKCFLSGWNSLMGFSGVVVWMLCIGKG